jgi:hypothetical protein
MSGRLVAHSGAEYIDREGLRALETPPATDTWTPIPHYDLVTALEGQLKARGIRIVKEQFAVQKAKLFGVIDTDYQVTEEGGAAIGIRTANDKSLALQLAIGYRVFIQRAGKRLKSIQVPAFQVCEQELSFFLARALRMILRRWIAST